MTDRNDFASMMEAFGSPQAGRGSKRLRVGETVEGTVVQITKDDVFVDVGAMAEGRIDRGELEDKKGELSVKLGDTLRARVASTSDLDGVKLVTALGRGGGKTAVNLSALEAAKNGELPVEGTVQKVVKGGLEVTIGAMRAFCPASQVDPTFVSDLSTYEGKQLSFRVMEIKDGGRSVVLSRRALLEKEKQREAELVLQKLSVGGDFDGVVQSVQGYGAFVDLGGGVEGLIHISELSHSRIDRVQDVLSVGETVTVRILSIEPNDKGPIPKLRLSLKARVDAPEGPKVEVGEVLVGKVSQVGTAGIFVETAKGTGLVPVRELGLPRGAEFRRAFPVDTEVRVVLMNKDSNGRLTFSIARVAGVEERNNYSEFSKAQTTKSTKASNVGSFGALLANRLGLPVPEAGAEESQSAPARETSTGQPRDVQPPKHNTDGMVRRHK